jgi:hypothetical protein
MMPSPKNWLIVPSIPVYSIQHHLEGPIHELMDLFGIEVNPETSAKRTVTCLRSPSRAVFDDRIFPLRCLGV